MDGQKLLTLARYLLARMKEPSSWAGIAMLLGIIGINAETTNNILLNGPVIAAALFSVIAVLLPDGKKVVLTDSHGDTTKTSIPVGSTADLAEGQ